MRSKAFTGPFFSETDELSEKINSWLKHLDGEIAIEQIVSDVVEGFQKVIIFYSDKPKTMAAPKAAWTPTLSQVAICGQCKKNPPVPGLKICDACREYQRKYRKERKAEKRARYP